MQQLELIATAPMGLEALVAQELRALGMAIIAVENGRVRFQGGMADICRANLWLRTADRVLVRMAEFPATTFEELFEGVKRVDWAAWIPEHGEFPVEGRSHKSQLSSVPACQGIVKKAVVEKLKMSCNREWFEETGPRYVIEVNLMDDVALITLDTTGPSLHKRGYRKLAAEAPLKETLAASMVLLSKWRPGRPLLDPFCGSGTLLIEAAMIGWNVAPGLRRAYPSEAWGAMPPDAWERAREEAFDLVKDDVPLELHGSDIDPEAIGIAEASAKKAGFAGELRFETLPAARVRPEGDYGVLMTNPPYGERLGDQEQARSAVRLLGRLKERLPTWSFFVLSPSKRFEQDFGAQADRKRKLYNGRIECQLHQYFGPLPPRKPASAPNADS